MDTLIEAAPVKPASAQSDTASHLTSTSREMQRKRGWANLWGWRLTDRGALILGCALVCAAIWGGVLYATLKVLGIGQ